MKTAILAQIGISAFLVACKSTTITIIDSTQRTPLATAELSHAWHKVPINTGGRTNNLFVPQQLHLSSAENETRPAISIDFIHLAGSIYTAGENEARVKQHIDEILHHEDQSLTATFQASVENRKFGIVPVYQLSGESWGVSLISVITVNEGWYLIELRCNTISELEEYKDDFYTLLPKINQKKSNKSEMATPRKPSD